MVKKIPASNAPSNVIRAQKPKRPKPKAVEVNSPVVSSEQNGTVATSRMVGSHLTFDSRLDKDEPIIASFHTKETPGLEFEDIVYSGGESGAEETEIPLPYMTAAMGKTLVISNTGKVQGQVAASLKKEVLIEFYQANESKKYAPYFLHEKIYQNSPVIDMHDFKGDALVKTEIPYLAQVNDRFYCTLVTRQFSRKPVFYPVADGYALTAEDIASGELTHAVRRAWLARQIPLYESMTLQCAYITSGEAAQPPAEVTNPDEETRLPKNALQMPYRRTAAFIGDQGLDLPPPDLQQSTFFNGKWWLNPENTKEGGDVHVPTLDTYAGDRICFYLSGPDHAPKSLGCVTIENDGDPATIELSPCDIACFFNKEMRLMYTLGFPNSEGVQESPEQAINVLVTQFPHPGIEQATNGILDLRTFSGDPTGWVDVWNYADCAKCCWMWITGEREDGSAYRFDILVDAPVTDAWKANGVDTPILRAELQELADCSEFELHFAGSYCGKCELENAHQFPAQTFTIEQEPLVLPEPRVTEAVGTNLTAWNGRNGIHVEVEYIGSNPKHSISVCWKKPDGTCWPLAPKPGSTKGAVVFALPSEAVIESLGKQVEITSKVITACKVQTSPPLNLRISLPVRVQTPNLLQATPPRTQNGIVDTRTFAGNADSFIDWMWFLRAGQKCSLRATGIDKSGAPYSFVVYAARTITAAEESAAFEVAATVLRSELVKAKDRSSMTFTWSVSTDGSPNENVFCPPRVLIVRVLTMVMENFESLPGGYYTAGTVLSTPLMTIRHYQATMGVHGGYSSDSSMTSGNAIAFSCSAGEGNLPRQQVDFTLKSGYSRLRFAYMRHVYYGQFSFYNTSGVKIGDRTFTAGSPTDNWIDFTAPNGELITKVVVITQQHSYTDNWQLFS
ncbi:hypothetical protein [Pseudomonas sp. MPB26]|uniref:hypothetical protein n=1 Tax=Pseudomonas sp. MPB26 TaxID=3388491 RepID=UPI0039850AC8